MLTGARACTGRPTAARLGHGCLRAGDPEFKAHCRLSLGFPNRPSSGLYALGPGGRMWKCSVPGAVLSQQVQGEETQSGVSIAGPEGDREAGWGGRTAQGGRREDSQGGFLEGEDCCTGGRGGVNWA